VQRTATTIDAAASAGPLQVGAGSPMACDDAAVRLWRGQCRILVSADESDFDWHAVYSPTFRYYLNENTLEWGLCPQMMAGWFSGKTAAINGLQKAKSPPPDMGRSKCAFCGFAFEKASPTFHADVAAHIRACTEHPVGVELRTHREIVQELVKVAAAYVQLADQILPQTDMPGVAANRDFARQWGERGVQVLKEAGHA
jgi:hypothetical protein